MKRYVPRRDLLRGVASGIGVASGLVGSAAGQSSTESEGFRPVEHGYGFRNWAPSDQYFETPSVDLSAPVRERIREDWRDQFRAVLGADLGRLPGPVVDAVGAQLRAVVAQRAGTNGHCYGMVLTAQRYFEDPESIPVDRRVASEIEDPTVPVGDPEAAPVYEEIVRRQASQLLRFRSWLGRRAMFRPEWLDVEAVLADVRAVVEAFGTASLTVFDGSMYGHQVLAYDVVADNDGLTVPIYDPNRSAAAHRGTPPSLRFERDGDGLSMRPYGRYTHVLFNRYDQIERATGRETATPLDHARVDRSTVRESLFPLAVVLVDSDDVDLTVVGPDGSELERARATHMDRSLGEQPRARWLYGAPAGTYRIGVFGTDPTEYEMTARVAGPEGEIVDATRSASVDAGELHEYELEVPEAEAGAVERDDDRERSVGAGVAGAVAGVAAGAICHRSFRRRVTDSDESGPDSGD